MQVLFQTLSDMPLLFKPHFLQSKHLHRKATAVTPKRKVPRKWPALFSPHNKLRQAMFPIHSVARIDLRTNFLLGQDILPTIKLSLLNKWSEENFILASFLTLILLRSSLQIGAFSLAIWIKSWLTLDMT